MNFQQIVDLKRRVSARLKLNRGVVAPVNGRRKGLTRHRWHSAPTHRKPSQENSLPKSISEKELESILIVDDSTYLDSMVTKGNLDVSGEVCLIQEGPLWILRLIMPPPGGWWDQAYELLANKCSAENKVTPPALVYRNLRKVLKGFQVEKIRITDFVEAAENGNIKEFERLYFSDPGRLLATDQRGRTATHQAAARNRVNILSFVYNHGGDLNICDYAKNTPLHVAIINDAFDAIDFLLRCDVKTDILNEKNQAPIHLITELNKVKALEVFGKYRHKIDIQQGGEHGRSALHLVAMYDHEDCARILISEFGASPRKPCNNGYYPIHEAAKNASYKTMEVFFKWGEAVGCNREEMMSFYDAEGNVPLHSAVHGGDIRAVKLCLQYGAKISKQQHDMSTPVHLACAQGALEMVQLMFSEQPMEKKACLSSFDVQKMTPLHCAAMFDHPEIVKYLVEEGADINPVDKESRSPLLLAASRTGWRTVLTLIRLGANILLKDANQRNVLTLVVMNGGRLEDFAAEVIKARSRDELRMLLNEKDVSGCSPLHYASREGHIRSLESLIRLGACINLKNNKNESPLHFAARYGRFHTVKQLLDSEKGTFIINESDGEGLTPLHIASKHGHSRVVQLLLNRGALLHRDHSGRNPLQLAAMSGYTHTMELLHSVHSHLIDQVDKDGNTALHLATMENKPVPVALLLSLNCKIVFNYRNMSAVDYAIQYKFPDVALSMVTHPERSAEILCLKSEKHPCVTLALIAAMPKVFEAVQDTCIIKANCKKDSKSFYIKYNFSCLQCPRLYAQVDEKTGETLTVENPIPLPALNAMVSHGRVELLAHPLSQRYLQMKWNAYGKYFHLANLLFYLVFLTFITLLVVTGKEIDGGGNPEALGNETENNSTERSYQIKDVSSTKLTLAILILVCIAFNTIRECLQMYFQRWNYLLDPSHSVSWLQYASAIIMVMPFLCPDGFGQDLRDGAAAVTIFLSWFNLLLFLQRFDKVGIYVVMFLEILNTLIRVLIVFSILIIAFGLAFYILLGEDPRLTFQEVPMSLMRTFTMMLEINFVDTFASPGARDSSQSSSTDRGPIRNQQTTYAILLIFMILMPILLMNLLIGLAVGDIESVRRNAQLKRLAMQVVLHSELERKLPTFFLERVDKLELIEYPNEMKCKLGYLDKILRKWFCNPFNEKGSSDIMVDYGEDVVVTELTKQKRRLKEISSTLETQQLFLRLIVQKMEIKTEADDVDEGISPNELKVMVGGVNKWMSPVGRKKLRAALSFNKGL